MTSVALEGVTKIFPGGTVALDKVTLDVADGEFMVLLGPSGCGKSTLLRIIAGLELPTAGAVLLDGEPVDDIPPRERGVAMVFQDYALYPHMNVGDNIGFPLKMSGFDLPERQRRTADAASALGIGDLLVRRIGRLSGGQRQRVAIGRAIVREPNLFVLDEPLSNLDAGQRAELRSEITGLARQLGVTVIYVTHDQTEALTMADRLAVMRRGVIEDVGTPAAVYNRPATMYVAAFLGNPQMSLVEARVDVHDDSHIRLVLGEQSLYLPWSHSRTKILSRYHSEQIVVGFRADAITPASGDMLGNGSTLNARIRSLEHHGHETLVFLDVGATAIAPDRVGIAEPVDTRESVWSRPLSAFFSRFGRGNGEYDDGSSTDHGGTGHGRHHRRSAEIPLRLTPYPQIKPGDTVPIGVDLEALHFFGSHGQRIDVGWR